MTLYIYLIMWGDYIHDITPRYETSLWRKLILVRSTELGNSFLCERNKKTCII